ncbi:MAG: hypothetical protein IJ689_05930 [Alphaproteobacteria bacterium]|nr:hypothetical protein [Alphaproteobacteria bacterium]
MIDETIPDDVGEKTEIADSNAASSSEESDLKASSQTAEETKYAGEYNSVEDLEKGYLQAKETLEKLSSAEKQFQAYQEMQKQFHKLLNDYQQLMMAPSLAPAYFLPQQAGNMPIYRENEQRASFDKAASGWKEENREWLDPKERNEIVEQAIEIAGEALDLPKAKQMIEALEKAAVDRYIKTQKAEAENQKIRDTLQTPTSESADIKNEKWLTRAEYNALSREEEDKMYDKILRQITLEKEGKLPRMLT